MVWRFVLHALFGLFQDLHAAAVSQPLLVPLDKSRREAGPCCGDTSDIMDDLCCFHSLHTAGGVLGVHPSRPGLLSAAERMVGKCVSSVRVLNLPHPLRYSFAVYSLVARKYILRLTNWSMIPSWIHNNIKPGDFTCQQIS